MLPAKVELLKNGAFDPDYLFNTCNFLIEAKNNRKVDFIILENLCAMMAYNPIEKVNGLLEKLTKLSKEKNILIISFIAEQNREPNLYNDLDQCFNLNDDM